MKKRNKQPLILKPDVDTVRERLKDCALADVANDTGLCRMTLSRFRNHPEFTVTVATLNQIIDYLNKNR